MEIELEEKKAMNKNLREQNDKLKADFLSCL